MFTPLSEARSLNVDTSPEDAIVETDVEEAILSGLLEDEMPSRTL